MYFTENSSRKKSSHNIFVECVQKKDLVQTYGRINCRLTVVRWSGVNDSTNARCNPPYSPDTLKVYLPSIILSCYWSPRRRLNESRFSISWNPDCGGNINTRGADGRLDPTGCSVNKWVPKGTPHARNHSPGVQLLQGVSQTPLDIFSEVTITGSLVTVHQKLKEFVPFFPIGEMVHTDLFASFDQSQHAIKKEILLYDIIMLQEQGHMGNSFPSMNKCHAAKHDGNYPSSIWFFSTQPSCLTLLAHNLAV